MQMKNSTPARHLRFWFVPDRCGEKSRQCTTIRRKCISRSGNGGLSRRVLCATFFFTTKCCLLFLLPHPDTEKKKALKRKTETNKFIWERPKHSSKQMIKEFYFSQTFRFSCHFFCVIFQTFADFRLVQKQINGQGFSYNRVTQDVCVCWSQIPRLFVLAHARPE